MYSALYSITVIPHDRRQHERKQTMFTSYKLHQGSNCVAKDTLEALLLRRLHSLHSLSTTGILTWKVNSLAFVVSSWQKRLRTLVQYWHSLVELMVLMQYVCFSYPSTQSTASVQLDEQMNLHMCYCTNIILKPHWGLWEYINLDIHSSSQRYRKALLQL